MNKLIVTMVFALLSGLAHSGAHEQTPGNALVFGGNGRLGAPIVRGLVEDGHPVTVFVRATSDLSRLDGLFASCNMAHHQVAAHIIGSVLPLVLKVQTSRIGSFMQEI